jgi:hypothetical protein
MDLSIIIVSWNVRDKLRKNLEALMKVEGDFSFETIVVDNDSNDGTAAMVEENFPQVRLMANKENLGFAKANNQALASAAGNFILLLNPDMEIYPDTLEIMLDWFENHPAATVASCRLVDQNGKDIYSVRRFPTLGDQLAIIFKVPHLFPGVLHKYLHKSFDYNRESQVDSVRGSFFMINRANFKKLANREPFLDERYFVWFEEVDFCRTVKQLGGEVWYAPVAKALDHVGSSFKQIDRLTAQKYFRDSMLKYFAKWEPAWQGLILKSAWSLVGLLLKMAPRKRSL